MRCLLTLISLSTLVKVTNEAFFVSLVLQTRLVQPP